MNRLARWDTLHYHTFLSESRSKPFAWGSWDCSLFAADGIRAITGVDIAEDFRGKYDDEASAFALIHAITGGKTVADAAAWCATKYGLTEWAHPLMAQRGDLVVVNNAGRLIAGLVHLSGRHIITVAESGLVRYAITSAVRSWHV